MEARELQLITVEDILKNIAIVRGQVGDRGVLRALHFMVLCQDLAQNKMRSSAN